jgi:hypothetical protein
MKYKNVQVTKSWNSADSVNFEVKTLWGKRFKVTNCHATHDYPYLGMPLVCLYGNCEELNNKNSHCSKGILHFYGAPLWHRCMFVDLLIENNS